MDNARNRPTGRQDFSAGVFCLRDTLARTGREGIYCRIVKLNCVAAFIRDNRNMNVRHFWLLEKKQFESAWPDGRTRKS